MYLPGFKRFFFLFSLIPIIKGLSFLLCIPYSIYFDEPTTPFYLSFLISLAIGLFFFFISDKKINPPADIREGFAWTALSWIVFILIGTLPYVIDGTITDVADVIYETTSGFTATGSSVVADVKTLPGSILFWRSLSQWLGGLGAILSGVFVFPLLNIGGYKLFSLSSSLHEQDVPGFATVLKRILTVYSTLSVLQILLLKLGGLSLFESLCYSFGTVSTGSFSPVNGPMSGYSSFIQYVMILFMFLSGISYVFYYQIITGKFNAAKRNEEVKLYAFIGLLLTVVIVVARNLTTRNSLEDSIKEGFFQLMSFLSSTGYSNSDYLSWPPYLILLLVFLLFIGGCTSTASGGIKISRFLVLFKNLRSMIISPSSKFSGTYNGTTIDEKSNLSILTFITLFGLVFLAGTILLTSLGISPKKSAFLAISALATFGHRLDLSTISDHAKILLSALMLIGRLEVYVLLVLLIPSFYKKTKGEGNAENKKD